MATLSSDRRRDGTLAIAASALAHLVFLALLLARLGADLPRDEAPVFDVQLVRPWAKPAPRPEASPRPTPHHTATPAPTVETRPEPALVQPPAPAAAVPPVTPNLGAALRGRLGCDHAGLVDLSPTERQRCQDRFAKLQDPAAGTAPKPLDLSGGIALRSREPILARIPHNGCVPNVSEQERAVINTAHSDWSAGIKCSWSFGRPRH